MRTLHQMVMETMCDELIAAYLLETRRNAVYQNANGTYTYLLPEDGYGAPCRVATDALHQQSPQPPIDMHRQTYISNTPREFIVCLALSRYPNLLTHLRQGVIKVNERFLRLVAATGTEFVLSDNQAVVKYMVKHWATDIYGYSSGAYVRLFGKNYLFWYKEYPQLEVFSEIVRGSWREVASDAITAHPRPSPYTLKDVYMWFPTTTYEYLPRLHAYELAREAFSAQDPLIATLLLNRAIKLEDSYPLDLDDGIVGYALGTEYKRMLWTERQPTRVFNTYEEVTPKSKKLGIWLIQELNAENSWIDYSQFDFDCLPTQSSTLLYDLRLASAIDDSLVVELLTGLARTNGLVPLKYAPIKLSDYKLKFVKYALARKYIGFIPLVSHLKPQTQNVLAEQLVGRLLS